MLDLETGMAGRLSLYNGNTLKLGLMASNCSSGRSATVVPERWAATWEENVALARAADDAGIDFMLPIARWKGYGGATNFEGAAWETVTWASGLLSQTKNITVFGTVHAPLVHPVFAAKQFVTADHMSRGRFALNVVCGWNADEFGMFGVRPLEHDARYAQGQEWIEVISKIWTSEEEFDFDGKYFNLTAVRGDPKPYGGTRPLIMNAGASPAGKNFALQNCDYIFTPLRTLEQGTKEVADIRSRAKALNRDVGVYSSTYIVCRPTKAEAEAYHEYYTGEMADWEAVDRLTSMYGAGSHWNTPEEQAMFRQRFAGGHGGYPVIGDPDHVANELAKVAACGYSGLVFSFVDYLGELPYFRQEVLPRLERLGLREPAGTQRQRTEVRNHA